MHTTQEDRRVNAPVEAAPGESGTPVRLDGTRDVFAQLKGIDAELEDLAKQFGTAVHDGDGPRISALATRLDVLATSRVRTAEQLAALEAAELAAKQERRRRELETALAELYEGWGALLEHRATVAELAGQLEHLRSNPPVDAERLGRLRQILEVNELRVNPAMDRLEDCENPSVLREQADRYRGLASGITPPDEARIGGRAVDDEDGTPSKFPLPEWLMGATDGTLAPPFGANVPPAKPPSLARFRGALGQALGLTLATLR